MGSWTTSRGAFQFLSSCGTNSRAGLPRDSKSSTQKSLRSTLFEQSNCLHFTFTSTFSERKSVIESWSLNKYRVLLRRREGRPHPDGYKQPSRSVVIPFCASTLSYRSGLSPTTSNIQVILFISPTVFSHRTLSPLTFHIQTYGIENGTPRL